MIGRGIEEPAEAGSWQPSQARGKGLDFILSDAGGLWRERGVNMTLFMVAENHCRVDNRL